MPVSWEWLSHRLVKLTGGRDENRLTKILLLKENKHVLYIFWNLVYKSVLIKETIRMCVRSVSSFVRSSFVRHTSLQKNVNGDVEP